MVAGYEVIGGAGDAMSEENEQLQELRPASDDHATEDNSQVGASAEQSNAGLNSSADQEVEQEMRRHTRRSFIWGAAAAALGLSGWRWLVSRREDDGIPWPLRRSLEINEHLSRDYFRSSRLAPIFPREAAQTPRVNGRIGLDDDLDLTTWRLRVLGLAEDSTLFTLDQIKALPRVEIVTELKCIE